MKLTVAQRECLDIMFRKGEMRAAFGYKPTAKLVELGLAERHSPAAFGLPRFTLTDLGRAALSEPTTRERGEVE